MWESPAGDPGIVAENPDFLVVRKPEGMHCLPSSGKSRDGKDDCGMSLAEWLSFRYPELEAVDSPLSHPARNREWGLVHRLDCGTSGLLLVARNEPTLSRFLDLQAKNLIVKDYRFLSSASTHGLPGSIPESWIPAMNWTNPEAESGFSSWPISVSSRFRPFGVGRTRVSCIGRGEKMAGRKETTKEIYTTLFLSATMSPSWQNAQVFDCRARITKGFRHQIRAHAAWIRLPLLGDTLYGGIHAIRICLHAQKIAFPDYDGRMLSYEDRGDDP